MDPVNLTANWKELGAEQLAQLKEEVRLSRDGVTRHGTVTRVPYLPSYSGDKGIDFKHYVSAIESISMSNNDAQVIQAIRKSVTGSAAQVIGILDYTTSKAKIVKQLQTNFGSITDTAASWQKFYAATQSTKESLVEWRTRVHQLYAKTENDSNNDLHLKTKLINGLQNQKLREQVFWKSEDITATEEDLIRLLRKLTEKSSTASTNPSVNTISAEESMKKEIESLRAQVASFTTKSEATEKEKPKDKNGKRHDSNDKEPQKKNDGYQSNGSPRHSFNRNYNSDHNRNDSSRYQYRRPWNNSNHGYHQNRHEYNRNYDSHQHSRENNQDYRRPRNNNNSDYRRPYNNYNNYRRPYNNYGCEDTRSYRHDNNDYRQYDGKQERSLSRSIPYDDKQRGSSPRSTSGDRIHSKRHNDKLTSLNH